MMLLIVLYVVILVASASGLVLRDVRLHAVPLACALVLLLMLLLRAHT